MEGCTFCGSVRRADSRAARSLDGGLEAVGGGFAEAARDEFLHSGWRDRGIRLITENRGKRRSH